MTLRRCVPRALPLSLKLKAQSGCLGLQVEEYSQRLKARSNRLDASEDRIAANRLLASEGFNSSRLAREMDAFEIKPSYEDVFQVAC